MEVPLYTLAGNTEKSLTLDDVVFDLPWNAPLVHQVVSVAQKNERVARAHTKTRGDVSGGGKKPWAQKHTGRARHGSTRSPIWVGGGVAFGPRNERNYQRNVNRKMRAKALFTVLSQKIRDKEVFIVDRLEFSEPTTKMAYDVTTKFFASVDKDFHNQRVLILTERVDETAKRICRNIPFVRVMSIDSVHALLLLRYKYIMLPQSALTRLISLRGPVASRQVAKTLSDSK